MFKSKTMWFSILLVVFGVVQQLAPSFKDLIPAEYYGLVLSIIGVIVGYLRTVTNVPLSEK